MATEVDVGELDGWFKTRYHDKIEKIQPSFNILSRKIPLDMAKKQGKDYRFPVRVQRSMGVTYNGGATYGDAFPLNTPVSGKTVEASVTGMEFILRDRVSYGAISKGKDSQAAFGNTFDEIVTDMTTSAAFHRELNILYGGTSIGAVSGTPNQPTATTAEVIISAASWSPGLWMQMIGGRVDVYDATLTTLRNDSTATATYTVTSVDTDTRTVLLTGEATDIDAIANTDVIVPDGANGNWFDGIDKIVTTTSGTLFGINVGTYPHWASAAYAAGGAAATMAKLTAAAAKVVPRSGMRDLTAYVSTYTWTDLNNDHAALRRFTNSTRDGLDLGARGEPDNIKYHGPNGTISIVPHPMVKAGEAFLIDESQFKRIGSTDTTFSLGVDGQQNRFFRELTDQAGVELRCYWDQALLCLKPNSCVKITGIVNTAG